MKKTKINFEDIKAGDLIEAVLVDGGVKCIVTGIAFQLETINEGWDDAHTFWSTSEGSMVVAKDEHSLTALYRIDVSETKFEDIRTGDLVRVTTKTETVTTIVEDVVKVINFKETVNPYLVGKDGALIGFKNNYDAETTFEILERAGE